jgi:hypothetical protein
MKLTVISWNIRHLRYEKVHTHSRKVREGLTDAHVAFLYENKMSNNDNVEMYEKLVKILSKAHQTDVEISALSIPVGTNEYVQVVYTEKREVGPNSLNHTPGENIEITVSRVSTYDDRLWDNGWESLKRSYNDTVRSEISGGRVRDRHGYRIPAVVEVQILKPDFTTRTVTIAAWHAPGPAKGTAPLLFEAYGKVLAKHVDLFVGDFNYNPRGSFAPPKLLEDVLRWYKVVGATTIQEEGGRTKHSSGPDLMYYNTNRLVSDGANVGAGKALIGNVEIRDEDYDLAEDLFELTDHLPLVVTLKRL